MKSLMKSRFPLGRPGPVGLRFGRLYVSALRPGCVYRRLSRNIQCEMSYYTLFVVMRGDVC